MLLSDIKIGYNGEKLYDLSWDMFEKLSEIISKDIISNNYHSKKICLLGAARGGLPLLTYISHHTGIRDISVVQLQMTQSDTPFDYGEVSVMLKAIREDYDMFIVLEDIIYKGKTIEQIQNLLGSCAKKTLAIYSLVIDEQYQNVKIKQEVKAVALLKENIWVRFPWEKK
jgi:hypoxanthine phosphoribosyltransferase